MMNPRSTALIVTLITASLAACGGGGGGGPQFSSVPSAQSTATASPSPMPTSATTIAPAPVASAASSSGMPSVTTQAGQEAQTHQALAIAGLSASISSIGALLPGVTPTQPFAKQRMTAQCETQSSSTSDNGNETAYVLYGFSTSQGAGCSSGLKPEFQLDMSVFNAGSPDAAHRMASSPVSGLVGNGLETFYNASGVAVAQNTIDYFNFSGINETIEGSFTSDNGRVTTAYALTCVDLICGSGNVINSADDGVAFGDVISSSNGGTLTVSGLVGGLNELSLRELSTATLPFYQIVVGGGSSYNENVTIAPNSTGFTLTDTTVGAKVVVTVSSTGAVTGIVYDKNGNQQASFNTDQFGNGTLTTSNNTTIPIAGFVVI